MNLNYIPSSHYKPTPWEVGKKAILFFSLVCFAASLLQVSLFTTGDDLYGFWVLIMGWIGLFFFQFAWFANPLNLLALLLLAEKPRVSLLLSVAAIALATQSFQLAEIPVGLSSEKIYIKELGLGFYFWFIAQVLLLTTILMENMHKKTKTSFV